MEPENPLKNYAELRRVERLQSRRENFLTTLRNVCKEKQYSYQQITGADDLNEAQWIEFRFIPKKNNENLPDYEFHKLVDSLVNELNSDEYYITWYEHPSGVQAVKVEIDES